MAYLPVELPTGDYYGGHRPGNGLFGETVVAVDLKTGQRKWHFQLVHHGIWDMDIPDAPMLVDITQNGQTVRALAQPTKQAFLYVFNRENGLPIWPIVERPVEQSDVPGEKTSPTQPFPTKPPAYDRQGFTVDDVIDFTPELKAEGLSVASKYKLGRDTGAGDSRRRHQLGWRVIRSGNPHRLYPVAEGPDCYWPGAAGRRPVGYAVYFRQHRAANWQRGPRG